MDFSQLKKNLAQGVSPVYCVYGEDVFLRNNALKQLKGKIDNPDMNLSVINADEKFDPADISSKLNMLPWGSAYRMVVLNNPKSVDALKGYLENPNPSTILVVYYEIGTPPEILKKHCVEVVCDRLDNAYIVRYLEQEGDAHDTAIERQAAELLIEYLCGDMSDIVNEAKKLFSYAQGMVVSAELVRMHVVPRVEYKIFDFTDAVVLKNPDKAYKLLRELRKTKTEPTTVINLLLTTYRRLLHLSLHPTSDPNELASGLGVKAGAVYNMRKKLDKYGQRELLKIVDKLCEAEYLSKSGADANSLIDVCIANILTGSW